MSILLLAVDRQASKSTRLAAERSQFPLRVDRICLVCILLAVAQMSCLSLGADGSNDGSSDASASDTVTSNAETGRMVGFTEAHNAVRRAKGVPDLSWSPSLATVAEGWATTLEAESCAMRHSGNAYGENLYWNWGFQANPSEVVTSWAAEESDYDYASGSCSDVCGHYTQVVWRDTTQLGCAMKTCSDGAEIWVCNYDPPGNYSGEKPY